MYIALHCYLLYTVYGSGMHKSMYIWLLTLMQARTHTHTEIDISSNADEDSDVSALTGSGEFVV